MNQARTFLLIAWLLVGYLVWDTWQQDYHRPRPETAAPASNGVETASPSTAGDLPSFEVEAGGGAATPSAATATAQRSRRIEIRTDVLDVQLDTQGGSLVQADLLDYRREPEAGSPPVRLLSTEPARFFVAQTGFVGSRADLPTHLAAFEVAADSYALADGEDVLDVPLRWQGDGLSLIRTYRFKRGSYEVEVIDRLDNQGAQAVSLQPYRQLARVQPPALPGSSFTNPAAFSFVGAAWFSPQTKFDKRVFADFAEEPLDLAANEGWVAMLEHYFFAAWIPTTGEPQRFRTIVDADGKFVIRTLGDVRELAPGAQLDNSARLYVGPKLQDRLETVAPGLKLTLDYGVFTILAAPMAAVLGWLHDLTNNWGWAIILLVVILKLLLFKLSEAQYKSFAKMRAVQPRIEQLKERYGEDRQKFQTAMMELYKKERINPMGGCLPILIQIPIFISLYWVLIEAVELRHAPWILWIENLTAPDPYFILPVLNLLTMWATQMLSPTPGMDPMQKRMMQIMPVAFGVMFAFFPAGLVLYWTTNGALGLLQQWIITRRHGSAATPKPAA